MRPCDFCRKPTDSAPNSRGRVYCADACRRAYFSKIASETMARTNRRHASDRMRERNPMRLEAVRGKVSRSHRESGHRPRVRGGNGTGPTKPQASLAAALGWPTEVVIRTGLRSRGYPSAYKVDVGNAPLRIAIEIDGYSHTMRDRKAEDAKKVELLQMAPRIAVAYAKGGAVGVVALVRREMAEARRRDLAGTEETFKRGRGL